MKNDYAWRMATIFVVVCLMAAALLTSCGGGGNTGLDSDVNASGTNDSINRGTGVLTITEDEVGSLPAWQQELLSDPGWNQGPIAQRQDTPMPAPSYEMLMDWQAQLQSDGITMAPRTAEAGKGSSWVDGTPTTGQINRGQYNIPYTPSGTVPYGCKDSGGTGSPPMMKEKKLAAEPIPVEANQAITFVLRGASASNHFNTTGGSSN
ncbi:MAG: hypothetical protein M3R04_04725, partial [bacterium]|nr:hypothetical protein [bacterium]